MNDHPAYLQIRIHKNDGVTQTFTLNDPDLVNRTLRELNPSLLFTGGEIRIADDNAEIAFFPSQLTRIDLITDRYTVWDFPFVLGAPVELTEPEFMECIGNLPQLKSTRSPSDIPVFLDLTLAESQRSFFWMDVVGGLPALRLDRIHSLLKARHFIFGLRTDGIGILNLASLTDFSIHPKPPEPVNGAGFADDDAGDQQLSPAKVRVRH